jgi:hypothetical protein
MSLTVSKLVCHNHHAEKGASAQDKFIAGFDHRNLP